MVSRIWADPVSGNPSYVAKAQRQLLSIYLPGGTQARPFGSTSFCRTVPTLAVTTTTYTVGPFGGAVDAETAADAGTYPFAFDTNQTGAVGAAPSGGQTRVDLLSVLINDPSQDGSSVPAPVVTITPGTAGSPGVLPSTPARSMAFARIDVPTSGGGSPTITFTGTLVPRPPTLIAGAAVGTQWDGVTTPIHQRFSPVVTTNGSGDANVAYPTAYANGAFLPVVTVGDTAGGLVSIQLIYSTQILSGFSVHCLNSSGSALASATVRLVVDSMGW